MGHPLADYRARHQPPLSRTELAVKLGVSPATVWRWEKGERTPDRKYLPELSRLTGAPIIELIGLEENGSERTEPVE